MREKRRIAHRTRTTATTAERARSRSGSSKTMARSSPGSSTCSARVGRSSQGRALRRATRAPRQRQSQRGAPTRRTHGIRTSARKNRSCWRSRRPNSMRCSLPQSPVSRGWVTTDLIRRISSAAGTALRPPTESFVALWQASRQTCCAARCALASSTRVSKHTARCSTRSRCFLRAARARRAAVRRRTAAPSRRRRFVRFEVSAMRCSSTRSRCVCSRVLDRRGAHQRASLFVRVSSPPPLPPSARWPSIAGYLHPRLVAITESCRGGAARR